MTTQPKGINVLNGAIVGIGGYGRVHLASLLQLVKENRIRMCAAVHTGAPHEADAAEELRGIGCELFLSVEEMFGQWAERLDFCTLPTSIPSHVPLALQCIERGIHCLVEKPLTGDMAQLEQLEAAMRDNPTVLITVGFQSMFEPEIRQVREKLANGQIGRVKSARVIGAWPRSSAYYNRNEWAGNIRSQDGMVYDSPMNNAMAHYLNLALYWGSSQTGLPANVESVDGTIYRAQEIDNFDTGSCRFNLDCGIPVSAWMTHSSREMIPIQVVVDGEEGTFVWDCDDKMQWEKAGIITSINRAEIDASRRNMFSEFLDVIEGKVRPQCWNVPYAAAHVRAVHKMQATIPVRNVAPSLLRMEEREDKQFTYIAGIEELLQEGFANNTLVTLETA